MAREKVIKRGTSTTNDTHEGKTSNYGTRVA